MASGLLSLDWLFSVDVFRYVGGWYRFGLEL